MAISELVKFDGGLSTKTSAHLIARNEGVVCENVNLEKGVLAPLSSLQFIKNVNGKHIVSYEDTIISSQAESDDRFYDEYGGRLYWTDSGYGSYGLMKYNDTDIGVNAEAPDAYPIADAPVTVSEETDYGQLTAGAIYTYALTIVDSSGIESEPVFLDPITMSNQNNKSIKICVDSTQIDTYLPSGSSVNIYRQGGANPTFNLVVEDMSPTHPEVFTDGNSFCWLDKIADIDVSRIELTTFENTPPTDGLDMLIEVSGTFWGASGKRVFFAKTGSPEFWGTLDYVLLDKECTGLGKFGDAIVAFTRTSAYLISGYSKDTVVSKRLPFNQGCINKHSVVNIDAYLLWTSMNGICLFDGSNIQVLTKKTLAWDEFGRLGNSTYTEFDNTASKWASDLGFDIKYAVGYQDKYYGAFNGGIVVLDLSEGLKVSTIATPEVEALAINHEDNMLYVVVSGESDTYDIYGLIDSDSKMEATWRTSKLTDGSVNATKHYTSVEIEGEPNSVEVFVDGNSIFTCTQQNRFRLPAGIFGKEIQFEIKTTGEVRGLKYEYSMLKVEL